MAKPAQQSMEAHLVEDSDEETGLEEMDVEANLCCPDALSAVLSTVFSPCWLCSLKMISQNERAVAWICGIFFHLFEVEVIHHFRGIYRGYLAISLYNIYIHLFFLCFLNPLIFIQFVESARILTPLDATPKAVLVWGKYVGSINEPGIHVVNPCGVEIRRVDTVRKTLDVREVSVTDKDGNPIYISGNIAYKIPAGICLTSS